MTVMPGGLRIDLGRPQTGVVIVRLVGDLDLLTCPALVDAAHELLGEWPRRVIVTLGQVGFLAVCGLRVLLEIQEHAVTQDCTLVLLAPPPSIARILALTRADQVIPVARTMGDALADVVPTEWMRRRIGRPQSADHDGEVDAGPTASGDGNRPAGGVVVDLRPDWREHVRGH